MLEPIEFPKARAGASLIIEETLTNISGIEVPRATRVIPTITSLIPNLAPNWALWWIKISAPEIKTPKPIKKINVA